MNELKLCGNNMQKQLGSQCARGFLSAKKHYNVMNKVQLIVNLGKEKLLMITKNWTISKGRPLAKVVLPHRHTTEAFTIEPYKLGSVQHNAMLWLAISTNYN